MTKNNGYISIKLTNESLSWRFVFLEFVVCRVVVVDVADVVDVVADVVDVRPVTWPGDNLTPGELVRPRAEKYATVVSMFCKI